MRANYVLIILINYIPFLHLVSGAALAFLMPDASSLGIFIFSWIYLVPPVACRLSLLVLGRPTVATQVGSREFFAWWMSVQWQNIFLRFPALEEALRMIPGLYSNWLRLWGARIGKYTYWTATCKVIDRPFVTIGDYVIVGYGAKIVSHLFHMKPKDSYFLFGEPIIGDYAVLGGDCGVGPGAKIPARQTVLAGEYVSPYKKTPREAPVNPPEVRA